MAHTALYTRARMDSQEPAPSTKRMCIEKADMLDKAPSTYSKPRIQESCNQYRWSGSPASMACVGLPTLEGSRFSPDVSGPRKPSASSAMSASRTLRPLQLIRARPPFALWLKTKTSTISSPVRVSPVRDAIITLQAGRRHKLYDPACLIMRRGTRGARG
jgi:hypothetical protein